MRVAVCGTGTGVGKTHVTSALALALRAEGRRLIALKPIETGGDGDARALAAACGGEPQRWLSLPEPISPHLAARRAGRAIDLAACARWIDERASGHDACLVETAGGLFSPLGPGIHNAALVAAVAADAVVLVAPDRLGVLHDVTATLLAAERLALPPMALVLSAPAEPDASTGSNAAELVALGVTPTVVRFARADAAAADSERAARELARALAASG